MPSPLRLEVVSWEALALRFASASFFRSTIYKNRTSFDFSESSSVVPEGLIPKLIGGRNGVFGWRNTIIVWNGFLEWGFILDISLFSLRHRNSRLFNIQFQRHLNIIQKSLFFFFIFEGVRRGRGDVFNDILLVFFFFPDANKLVNRCICRVIIFLLSIEAVDLTFGNIFFYKVSICSIFLFTFKRGLVDTWFGRFARRSAGMT